MDVYLIQTKVNDVWATQDGFLSREAANKNMEGWKKTHPELEWRVRLLAVVDE